MKRRFLFIIPVCVFILAGICIFMLPKRPAEPILCHVEVPDFPVMSNPDSAKEDTSYQVLSESTGVIAAYTIHENNIYYIVGYPFDLGITGYRYMSIFQQPLTGGEVEKVTDYESDKYMEVTELYYDEQLGWIGCVDDYELWQYTLNGNHVEEVPYVDEELLAVEDVVKGYDVDAATLDGRTWICHESETYVVWAKWPYLGDAATSIGSTTNILNKKTGEITVIQNSDYCEGALSGQVLYGDYLFFHVYDDEKAHVHEEDCFENNYMFDLRTGQAIRLTTNYGTLGETDSIFYDKPKIYEDGICFLSQLEEVTKETATISNQYMYYIVLE